jgi:7,8-dihydroneopterin aldolase/epimerase/oxygenase
MKEHLICVNNLSVHGYHGCLPEEALIGTEFIVNVWMVTDFSEAALNDDLSKTIDYVAVSEIVLREMKVRSKLIEQVGQRIVDGLWGLSSDLKEIKVEVRKLSPPIGIDVNSVSVWITEKRNQKGGDK